MVTAGCGAGVPRVVPGLDPGGEVDAATSDLRAGRDAAVPPGGDLALPSPGCGEAQGCFTVWAHSDHFLYRVDLAGKELIPVGPFDAPGDEIITDLAVAPDDTVYTISATTLYTASPVDGHVTAVGKVSTCGSDNVALTFAADGTLYAADHKGAFCRIDLGRQPIGVTPLGTLGGGYAIAGDLVAVSDGTLFGTAYQPRVAGSAANNVLVRIDPATGHASQVVGPTGFPRLYGVAFEEGRVFGFTHDGSGDVLTIDPRTGLGTRYNSFRGPDGKPISFAGAGVNARVMAPNPG